MANHHGKTWTEVHGKSAKQRREEKRAHKLQQKQYKHFGKVNWDAFSHRQMWDMIQTAKPQQMYNKADDWTDLATRIGGTTERVQNLMQKLMTTWRGSAAVTASQSNTRLTEWGGQASNTATGIASGLQHYADAVTHAQTTMPEPVDYVAQHRLAEGYAVKVTDPELHSYLLKNLADDHMATREEAKTAKARAVQVMNGYEDRSHQVHEKLPEFQQAPSMAPRQSSTPVASPGTPGGQGPTQTIPHAPGQGGTTTNPGADGTTPGTTTPSWALPPTGGTGPGYPGGPGPYPGGTGPGLPTPGIPGANGGGPNGFNGLPGPGGIGGVPGMGGTQGIAGARSAAGFGSGAAGEGPAGARGSGVGALGSAAAAEEAAAARGAAGGRGGGMGGMYPPMGGSGANGEGDGEHHNKYDNGLDLFDDIPPAYPSVFGE